MPSALDSGPDADRQCLAAWVDRGDRDALQAVFERHAPLALRLAASRLGNLSDADDAVQHAFVGLMRSARHYRPERGSVRAWLMTAVLNACVEQRRSQTRRVAREAATAPPAGAGTEPDPDLRDALETALAQLPEHQRQPVELRYLAGLDFPEIAAALGRNERTVRGQVTRGLESLRDACGRLGLRRETTALGAALAALPGPTAEAAARTAAVAATGPSAAATTARLSPFLVPAAAALLVIVAALLVLQPWRGPRQPGAGPQPPPPPPTATATAAPEPAAPRLVAGRERRLPAVTWMLPDDASTGMLPVVAVGAARPAEDPAGLGSAWWVPAPLPGGDWWGTRVPVTSDVRRDWTPSRLLRAPRAGEDCHAVVITPRNDDGDWHYALSIQSVLATEDGWHLVFQGLRTSIASFGAIPGGPRAAFAVALGRLPANGTRITIEIRWLDNTRPSTLLPNPPRIERGEVRVAAENAAGPVVLDRFLPEIAAAPAAAPAATAPPEVLEMPMRIRALTAAEAPERLAGLVETTRVWMPWNGSLPSTAGMVAAILGPALRREDDVSVRSLSWQGNEVTARIAVWMRGDGRAAGERRRPLVPVWIERPPGVVGPITVRLEWEHFVADGDTGVYRLQAGTPAFAGRTRMDDVDVPEPALPEPRPPLR